MATPVGLDAAGVWLKVQLWVLTGNPALDGIAQRLPDILLRRTRCPSRVCSAQAYDLHAIEQHFSRVCIPLVNTFSSSGCPTIYGPRMKRRIP